MRPLPAVAIAIPACVACHLVLGWPFTVLGAGIGAFVADRRGWLVGVTGGSTSWLALAAWSRWVDARAVDEMLRVVGVILGDLPGEVVFFLTVLIGGSLGLAGGWVGSAVRNLLIPNRR